MKVVAIIPAFNEEKTVGTVVKNLLPLVSEVIVVNDGSKDATADVASRAGAIVISHENAGYDATLTKGFAEAHARGADIFVTIDADGEHDVNDTPRVIESLVAGKADLALGQRPHTTHLAEAFFALYTTFRYGITDPLCGFKAYTRKAYESVGFFDSLSGIGTELMIRCRKNGFKIVCVPIALHSRVGDTSRFYAQKWRANMKIFKALFRVASI